MGLKQNIKKILVEKQHREYEALLSEKKMSYEDWIKKQEETIKVDDIIALEEAICQKNEKERLSYEGCTGENEGKHSEYDRLCCKWQVFDSRDEVKQEMLFLELPYEPGAFLESEKILSFIKNTKADVILFRALEGEMAAIALPCIYQKFRQNKNIILIYGDEDVKEDPAAEEGRKRPWFKPDWSPDTFLSYFYFGSFVAIRKEEAEKALEMLCKMKVQQRASTAAKESDFAQDSKSFVYGLCATVILNAGGFSRHKGLFDEAPVCHVSEVLFHTKEEGYERVKEWKLSKSIREMMAEKGIYIDEAIQDREKKPLISIIIPSKDNPKVLFTCIHSLLEKTESDYPFEIFVIDNGSSEENRAIIEKESQKLCQNPAFRGMQYHYKPMTFNFSRMCNLGVSLSRGEMVLFLNDDMEIIQKDWLTLLADKVMLPYVGAAGAKLLYPDSDVIQHAGITNLRVGPAHKLQFLSDSEVHYYGKNRFVHNMLASTGACLLLKRAVFEEVGEFSEELAVAFNDVDLCYKIYEAGYYNVQRNDVILYHHESLSRGKDGESPEKQQRLLREKDILYAKHQEIYGKDPFYHKYLTTDMLESEYSPAVRYQVTLEMPWAVVKHEQKLPDAVREDGCVVIGMEAAMDIYKWKYGVAPGNGKQDVLPEELGYYFQGYSFIIGADNACYKKTLLLKNMENEQVIRVPLDVRYRPDIRKNLSDQLNVDLTGYAAKVKLSDIPHGNYRFGMLAEERFSRQKLVNWSSWTLSV